MWIRGGSKKPSSPPGGPRQRVVGPGVVTAFLSLVLLGCGPSETSSPPEPAAVKAPAAAPAPPDANAGGQAAVEAARAIFDSRCVTCHGAAGAGDGPGSAALDPKPRDFRDPEWQQSVSDEQIQQAILYGGAAIGKSPAMPGNPDLMAKPEVTAALVDHLRGLGQR